MNYVFLPGSAYFSKINKIMISVGNAHWNHDIFFWHWQAKSTAWIFQNMPIKCPIWPNPCCNSKFARVTSMFAEAHRNMLYCSVKNEIRDDLNAKWFQYFAGFNANSHLTVKSKPVWLFDNMNSQLGCPFPNINMLGISCGSQWNYTSVKLLEKPMLSFIWIFIYILRNFQ